MILPRSSTSQPIVPAFSTVISSCRPVVLWSLPLPAFCSLLLHRPHPLRSLRSLRFIFPKQTFFATWLLYCSIQFLLSAPAFPSVNSCSKFFPNLTFFPLCPSGPLWQSSPR